MRIRRSRRSRRSKRSERSSRKRRSRSRRRKRRKRIRIKRRRVIRRRKKEKEQMRRSRKRINMRRQKEATLYSPELNRLRDSRLHLAQPVPVLPAHLLEHLLGEPSGHLQTEAVVRELVSSPNLGSIVEHLGPGGSGVEVEFPLGRRRTHPLGAGAPSPDLLPLGPASCLLASCPLAP